MALCTEREVVECSIQLTTSPVATANPVASMGRSREVVEALWQWLQSQRHCICARDARQLATDREQIQMNETHRVFEVCGDVSKTEATHEISCEYVSTLRGDEMWREGTKMVDRLRTGCGRTASIDLSTAKMTTCQAREGASAAEQLFAAVERVSRLEERREGGVRACTRSARSQSRADRDGITCL